MLIVTKGKTESDSKLTILGNIGSRELEATIEQLEAMRGPGSACADLVSAFQTSLANMQLPASQVVFEAAVVGGRIDQTNLRVVPHKDLPVSNELKMPTVLESLRDPENYLSVRARNTLLRNGFFTDKDLELLTLESLENLLVAREATRDEIRQYLQHVRV